MLNSLSAGRISENFQNGGTENKKKSVGEEKISFKKIFEDEGKKAESKKNISAKTSLLKTAGKKKALDFTKASSVSGPVRGDPKAVKRSSSPERSKDGDKKILLEKESMEELLPAAKQKKHDDKKTSLAEVPSDGFKITASDLKAVSENRDAVKEAKRSDLPKEGKKSEKKDVTIEISVSDLRTEKKVSDPKEESESKSRPPEIDTPSSLKSETENGGIRFVSGESRSSGEFMMKRSEGTLPAFKNASSGYEALSESLKNYGNSGIVKQAKFILRDGGSGEMKLVLKPEEMGMVRINLNLSDNNVVGKIIVDNINVRDIFEQNLAALQRTFEENGFSGASLDLSLSGGRGKENDFTAESGRQFFSRRLSEDNMDLNIVYSGYEGFAVDLMV